MLFSDRRRSRALGWTLCCAFCWVLCTTLCCTHFCALCGALCLALCWTLCWTLCWLLCGMLVGVVLGGVLNPVLAFCYALSLALFMSLNGNYYLYDFIWSTLSSMYGMLAECLSVNNCLEVMNIVSSVFSRSINVSILFI